MAGRLPTVQSGTGRTQQLQTATDYLSLGVNGVVSGTIDPSVTGFAAPEGSIFQRFVSGAGTFWIKTGSANTAWARVETVRSVGISSDATVNSPRYIKVPYRGIITSVFLISDIVGSVVVDVWKVASGSVPTVANTITASALPTLSSAQTYTDATLTGWTKQITANDVFGFNVNSTSTIGWFGIQLFVTPN